MLATKAYGGKTKKTNYSQKSSSTEGDGWTEYLDEVVGYSNDYYGWYFEIFEPSCSGCNDSPIEQYQGDPYDSSNYPDCYYTGDCDGYVIYDSNNDDSGSGETNTDEESLIANEYYYRSLMSEAEETIFDNLTRQQQILYLNAAAAAAADWETEKLYPTRLENYNGRGDAFKHCYWNALSTIGIGESLTKILTDAHEEMTSSYPYQIKEKEMDLFNNNVGRNIVSENPSNYVERIQEAIFNGELRYLNNVEQSGDYIGRATHNSELIPTNEL